MRQQEYFNALEIAETAKRIGTNSVPHTKQKVLDLAVREGWNTSKLARYRQGRGGGMEYHFSLLPERFVRKMVAAESQERELAEAKAAMIAQQKALVQLGGKELSAQQRQVMEARAANRNSTRWQRAGRSPHLCC